MATLDIGGRQVEVGDEFLKLPPDQQNAAVEEIAGKLGIKSGPAQKEATASSPGALSFVDNVVRQTAKGMPIVGGAVDRFSAATDAATQPVLGRGSEADNFSGRYATNLQAERTKDATFEKEHPYVSTAANVGGGILGTALGLRYVPGMSHALGMVGSLPTRFATGTLGGATIGATDAAVRGHDPVAGGTFGGGLGGAFPIIGRGLGKLTESLGSVVPEPVAQFGRTARAKIIRAMTDDVVTPQAVRDLGPNAMLVDAGPNLRLQGEALATQPGPANRVVSDAVRSRHELASARIRDEVDNTLGPYRNFRATKQAAIDQRREAGNRLYTQAFDTAQPVNIAPAIEAIDQVVRPGLSRTISQGGPAPDSIEAVLTRVRNVLGGGQTQRIDARELHTVKMDLDDMIDSAIRGGKNNQARLLSGVRNHVVDGLEDATGGPNGLYAQARRQFRSDSAVVNALDDGRNLFKRTIRPDDLVASVREMSAAERDAFRIGSRDAIDEVMGNAANDSLAARNLLGRDWNEQKLRAVVGDQEAQRLLSTIGRENTFAQTHGAIERGSQTRGRLAAGAEFPNTVADPPQLLRGQSLYEEAVRRPVNAAWRGLRTDAVRKGADAEALDVAHILTAQGAPRDQVIAALMTMASRNTAARAAGNRVQDIATLMLQGGAQEPFRLDPPKVRY